MTISPWDDGDDEVTPHEAEDEGAGEEEVEDGDPHPAKDYVEDDDDDNDDDDDDDNDDDDENWEHLPTMRGKQRKAISLPAKFDLIL